MKILIADDQDTMRQMYGLMLADFDCKVLEAATGLQAVDLAIKEKPNLVILDHVMPEMTGYEVLKRIRAHPDLCKVPILFITGRDFDESMREMIKMEAQGYVQKPFTAIGLAQAIEKALGKPLARTLEDMPVETAENHADKTVVIPSMASIKPPPPPPPKISEPLKAPEPVPVPLLAQKPPEPPAVVPPAPKITPPPPEPPKPAEPPAPGTLNIPGDKEPGATRPAYVKDLMEGLAKQEQALMRFKAELQQEEVRMATLYQELERQIEEIKKLKSLLPGP